MIYALLLSMFVNLCLLFQVFDMHAEINESFAANAMPDPVLDVSAEELEDELANIIANQQAGGDDYVSGLVDDLRLDGDDHDGKILCLLTLRQQETLEGISLLAVLGVLKTYK